MLDKLQVIVRHYTADETITMTEDMVLLTGLGLNSFELVQLICDVEDAFAITIPDRAITTLKTVADVLGYVEKQQKMNCEVM